MWLNKVLLSLLLCLQIVSSFLTKISVYNKTKYIALICSTRVISRVILLRKRKQKWSSAFIRRGLINEKVFCLFAYKTALRLERALRSDFFAIYFDSKK